MISHELGVVFVHIPKTAGTSIELALGHHGPPGPDGLAPVVRGAQDHRTVRQLQWWWAGPAAARSVGNLREAARGVKAAVRPPAWPANRERVSRAQWQRYCTFAVVRNPWARVHSAYRNVVSDPLHRARWDVPEGVGLTEFLVRFGGIDLLRPQTSWLLDHRGRIGVEHVCRFERLDADLDVVRKAADLPDLVLPHANRGAGSPPGDAAGHPDAYDDRARRLVAQRYRDEIDRFGYTFDR